MCCDIRRPSRPAWLATLLVLISIGHHHGDAALRHFGCPDLQLMLRDLLRRGRRWQRW